MKAKHLILLLDVAIFLCLLYFSPFGDTRANSALSILIFIAILWLTEALHLSVVALLIPILSVILGLLKTKEALVSFADPNIFLFFGGFALASAMHIQALDKFIAQKVIDLTKGHFGFSIFALFGVTALLSMWMSNTAIALVVLPLSLGMLSILDYQNHKNTYTFTLLGVAFSASIGGMGTIVGTPPNAIVATQLQINFAQWLMFGIPIVLVLLPTVILVLFYVFKPKLSFFIPRETTHLKLNSSQKVTLLIFALTALAWIFSSPINNYLSSLLGQKIASFDAVIALCSIVVLCACGVVSWKEIQSNTDWGILLLFGGGITLSVILRDSGASTLMANWVVSLIEGGHLFVIGLSVALFTVFLTEVTSNTASAALLVPLFISIADSLGVPSLGLALMIGFGVSCAFMLPVATPPNAIVYGTGYIEQRDMVRVGLILNFICAFILASIAYFFWLH